MYFKWSFGTYFMFKIKFDQEKQKDLDSHRSDVDMKSFYVG